MTRTARTKFSARTALQMCGLGVGALAMLGCHKAQEGPPTAPPPVSVSVATARSIDAPVLLRTIGAAESKARVMLRPQITARVASLAANEGTDVEKGQKIVEMDAGPFQTALNEAQANVLHAQAVAEDAHRLADRVAAAAASSAVSQREVEEARAKAKAADADVASMQARVETMRWDISYCTIAAPYAGRLGAFLVKPGAVVKANEADLVELVQTDPIDVSFAVPEENIPVVRQARERGPVQVQAVPSGESEAVTGELTFVDSRVDPATGTIRLKATFANSQRRLWPGRYANVTLVLGQEPGSVAVPEAAIQASQNGQAVFVVKPDQTVDLRPVKVRRVLDGQAILDSGVAAGDVVVTEGQLRLGPNAKVQIKGPPGAPQQPAAAQAAKPAETK